MEAIEPPVANQLLAGLPPGELAGIEPHLAHCELALGEVMHAPGSRITHLYFPTTCIVSLMYTLKDGASTEIAMIGRDGVVGTPFLMGSPTTPTHAIVQTAGGAWRAPADVLQRQFWAGGQFTQRVLRYCQALAIQIGQTAVCNRHHTVLQQLCRWLLMSLDRLSGQDLVMTQDLIADMLGVRRGGVTEAALRLQHEGLIRYSRGHITVVDRPMLERRCCECYAVVKGEYDRLLK